MPLRALVNGKSMTSVEISPLAWDRLKLDLRVGSAHVVLPCCQGRGFLRRSVRHLQHFVHAPGSACEHRHFDSGNYLEILSIIHRAAEKSGFPFEIETRVLDISLPAVLRLPRKHGCLAVLGFEKKYTATQILDIQKRLAAQHVRGCWLVTSSIYDGLSFGAPVLQDKPVFRIEKSPSGWITCLRGGMPLEVFLVHLFQGHFHYEDHAAAQRAEDLNVLVYRIRCPRCHQPSAVYALVGNHISLCDLNLGNVDRDRFRLEVVAAVRNLATKTQLPLGHIAIFDKSEPPGGSIYCPVCRKNLRDAIRKDIPRHTPTIIRTEKIVWKTPLRFPFPHWCFSISRKFCE